MCLMFPIVHLLLNVPYTICLIPCPTIYVTICAAAPFSQYSPLALWGLLCSLGCSEAQLNIDRYD